MPSTLDLKQPLTTDQTAPGLPPGRRWAWLRLSHVDRARILGAGVAAFSTVLLLWGLGRPALWLDEAATVVATRRSWTGLSVLLGGDEAPLTPYYALLKLTLPLWDTLSGNSIEVAYRLPSVVAAVAAAGFLSTWLARNHGGRLALATATTLLLTLGFSRYGQEARGYAIALLCSVLATAAWWRLARDRSRRWIPLYAVSLLGLIAAHPISALLAPAQLAASVLAVPAGRRRDALLRTSAGAAAGLALAAPLFWATSHAGGATRTPPLNGTTLATAFLHLFDFSWHSPVLALAAVGLAGTLRGEHVAIARVAACWAVLPVLLFVPVVLARPNLLVGRYLLFTLPGWAVLAGLGMLALVEQARFQSRFLGRFGGTGTVVGVGVGVGVVMVLVATQYGGLRQLRTPGGHGEDIRPALAAAASYGGALPLALPRLGAIELQAYRPELARHLVGLSGQNDQSYLWATQLPSESRSWELRGQLQVGLLLRTPPSSECPRGDDAVSGYVERCMPTWLSSRSYAVAGVFGEGTRWTFAELERTSGPGVGRVRAPARP